MTREDTKAKKFDILHFVADNAGLSTFEAIEKAYYMGVSERESCKDAISRQDVLDMAFVIQTDDCSGNETMEVVDVDDIKALPSVKPVHKKGKWIVEDSGNYNGIWSTCYCSNCKDYYTRAWRDMKYCPNCGSQMSYE